MSDILNVTILQSSGTLDGPSDRIAWLQNTIENEVDENIDLVILPELFQSGYFIDKDVITRAEEKNGPFHQAVAMLAKKHQMAILYGYAEKTTSGTYNSAQCIDKNGQIIGHHRKLLLPPGFEQDYFIEGNQAEPFMIGSFKIGILICYDIEFPENARHLAMSGTDLIVVPTALGAPWGVVAEKIIPARAFENGIYVIYANHGDTENKLTYHGVSCVIAPNGIELARAGNSIENYTDRQKLPWVDNGLLSI